MWTRWWTYGCHKMLGSYRVAAQLAASQAGHSSMSEWVMSFKMLIWTWCFEQRLLILQPFISFALMSNFLLAAEFDILRTVIMNSTVLWDVMLCSSVEVHKYFGGIYCLFTCILLVTCLAYSFTPKTEAVHFPGMSVKTTRCDIPDNTLSPCCFIAILFSIFSLSDKISWNHSFMQADYMHLLYVTDIKLQICEKQSAFQKTKGLVITVFSNPIKVFLYSKWHYLRGSLSLSTVFQALQSGLEQYPRSSSKAFAVSRTPCS
jgi:hypothetical protein